MIRSHRMLFRVAIASVVTAGSLAGFAGLASAAPTTAPSGTAHGNSAVPSIAALLKKLPKPPARIKASQLSSMPVLGKQAIPLVKVNPDGTLDPAQTSPAGCRFQPSASGGTPGTIQNPHFSTSVPGAVKVNSYIVCNAPVEALANETNLYKLGFFGLVWELQDSTVTDNTGQAVLANLGTYVQCTSSTSSTFTGTAYGISEENGQLYEGYGASPGEPSLACGTPLP